MSTDNTNKETLDGTVIRPSASAWRALGLACRYCGVTAGARCIAIYNNGFRTREYPHKVRRDDWDDSIRADPPTPAY